MDISLTELKALASRLKIDMKEEEYRTLHDEFSTVIRQMDLIDDLGDLNEVEPMTFPFAMETSGWREDEVEPSLSVEEVLQNAPSKEANMIKVKRVVM